MASSGTRQAGAFRSLLSFQKRAEIDDGYGNKTGEFVEQFKQYAAMTALRGSETVIASRLTGVQPYNVTVRYNGATAGVDTAWRCVDLRLGTVLDITAIVPRPGFDYIDFTCTSGKAA